MSIPVTPTPIEKLEHPLFTKKGIEVFIKRDDLTHPEIMGNKWRKLKYNLKAAKDKGKQTIATYGGAFSNHIAATAAAGKEFGFKTTGIIRGEELNEKSNPTLKKAHENGMELVFVTRNEFTRLKNDLKLSIESSNDSWILPEGGTNIYAIQGCRELGLECRLEEYDIVCTAMGTMGTFTGLAQVVPRGKKLLGFSALKGNWIKKEAVRILDAYEVRNLDYIVFEDHFFGGYGKYNKDLIQFILDFSQYFGILLDPIYTGKMFFSVWEMIENNQIAVGSRILLIHTGGLQGIEGFNYRYNLELPTR